MISVPAEVSAGCMGLPDFQLTDTSGTAACSQSVPCLPLLREAVFIRGRCGGYHRDADTFYPPHPLDALPCLNTCPM